MFGSWEPQQTRHGGPKPANYAAQGSSADLPEAPGGEVAWKTSEGVCVPWVCPGNSLRGGATEPMGGTRLDALAACKSAGIVFKTRLLEVLHAGEALAGEVPGASEFQDAHSRNSSEPTTLVLDRKSVV